MAVIREKGHQLLDDSLVNTKSLRQAVQIVKHLKEQGAGLMDGADHCPSFLRQALHQGDALATRCAVQTAVVVCLRITRWRELHVIRRVHKFNC